MHAIVLHACGGPERLQYEAREPPNARPGWVVVKVHAEGVCYRDIVERRGGFAFIKQPVVPGHEWAGEIVEIGAGVIDFAIGDRVVNLHRAACGACEACRRGHETRCRAALEVFGLSVDGGYAQLVAAPVGCLVRLPAEIPFAAACFLNCTAGVALRALRSVARVVAGERVLVTGASGGVGAHAIQIAKVLGAHVIAATSNDAKRESLRDLGADTVVVSAAADLHRAVKRETAGTGVDVVLDCVGTPTLNASLRSLRAGGRLVVVGNVTGDRWEVNPGFVILAELQIMGSAGCNRDDLEQVLAWVAQGRVRPIIAEQLPLSAAAEAHRRLERQGVTGRIVLLPWADEASAAK